MTGTTQIPTRPLGRTGEEVTIFGLGGEGVLRTHGRSDEAMAVIHRALDLGVNYCDSAPAYSGCLDYLGEALGDRRQQVILASKTHVRTRDDSLRLLDETLKRLRTDHLDLWQLHDLRTPADLDRIFSPHGAMQALLEARDEGRVRFLGITGHHDPAILLEAMRRFEFDTVLVALNAADRHRLPFTETVLPAAAAGGMGVIAMKVYGGGPLVGQGGLKPEQAMTHTLSLPGVSMVIIGCSTPGEVEENARIAREFSMLDRQRISELEQMTTRDAAAFAAYKKQQFISLD